MAPFCFSGNDMIHDPRCYDCLLSRVDLEIELANVDKKKYSDIPEHAEEIIRFLQKTPWTHPMVASALHRVIYQRLNNDDPFMRSSRHPKKFQFRYYRLYPGVLSVFGSMLLPA